MTSVKKCGYLEPVDAMPLILDRDALQLLTGECHTILRISNKFPCFQTDPDDNNNVDGDKDIENEALESDTESEDSEEGEDEDVFCSLAKQLKKELKFKETLETYIKHGDIETDHDQELQEAVIKLEELRQEFSWKRKKKNQRTF